MLTFTGKIDPNKPLDHTGITYLVGRGLLPGWSVWTYHHAPAGESWMSGGARFATLDEALAYLRSIGAPQTQIHVDGNGGPVFVVSDIPGIPSTS